MMRIFAVIWLWIVCALGPQYAYSAESGPIDTGKVVAQLVSSHDSAAPGETFHIALKTRLDDKWHTYWKNPGDSGEPVHIRWNLPPQLTAGEIVWPLPAPIATGPIVNYGFEGTPYFPVPFTLAENAAAGERLDISANVYYLVCYDVCIPEQAELSLSLQVGERQEDTLSKAAIDQALLSAPKRQAAIGGLVRDGDDISITIKDLPSGADLSESYFFAFDAGYIQSSAAQISAAGQDGVEVQTSADFLWDDGAPAKVDGVIRYKQGGEFKGEIVSLKTGEAVAIGKRLAAAPTGAGLAAGNKIGFFAALIGAFLGGLILNLMPCVFPVISMKALHLTHAAHNDMGVVRREAWLYTFGVLASFLLLTVLLLSIKAAGTQIGWGFQLQSPIIVGFLALLLFVIGLNLLGVFEIGGRLQNIGGSLTHGSGAKAAFFTGVLATIVATPCTAPFMAGATGYAMAQSAPITIIIFMALAIGFALPFLLLAYSPSLLRRLPKPGLWMTRFKELLSFPMFAAAIWLVWVVTQQAGDLGLLKVLTAMLLAALGVWLFKSPKALVKTLAVIALLGALILPASLRTFTGGGNAVKAAHTSAWSPDAVQAALSQNKTVFIDFTAAWCVTCKVNERLVIALPKVQARLADDNVVFMVADWTNKNEAIAAELSRHGRSGVPLYLVYRPDDKGVSPQILPQILTQDVLLSALK